METVEAILEDTDFYKGVQFTPHVSNISACHRKLVPGSALVFILKIIDK